MIRIHATVILLCAHLTLARGGDLHMLGARSATPDAFRAVGNDGPRLTTDSLIQRAIDQTNLDTLIQSVDALSGEDSVDIDGGMYLIRSRDAAHPHNELAADYLFQTLRGYGLLTYSQQFSSGGRNVYSVKTGAIYPERKVIVCAHYDDRPYEPGPGADDNASGTAVVLEAARILSQMETRNTVIFALWDLEEVGLLGSAYYADRAYRAGENIRAVVNLDMVGWDGNGDGVLEVHTSPVANSMQLAGLVTTLENEYDLGLSPVVFNPGATASDHSRFWNYGYSAVLFIEGYWSGDFNPQYHSSDDKRASFNMNYFHAASKLAVATITHLSLNDFPGGEGVIPPSVFSLGQNYPNPFNPSTTIEYEVPSSSYVRLAVYDVLGQEVALLANGVQESGPKSVVFDASDLPSGMYLYKLTAGEFEATKKLMVLK